MKKLLLLFMIPFACGCGNKSQLPNTADADSINYRTIVNESAVNRFADMEELTSRNEMAAFGDPYVNAILKQEWVIQERIKNTRNTYRHYLRVMQDVDRCYINYQDSNHIMMTFYSNHGTQIVFRVNNHKIVDIGQY